MRPRALVISSAATLRIHAPRRYPRRTRAPDDGTVETTQRPIYDRIGNLVVLADELGKPVERYTYKPFGPEKTEADLTPPQLMQIRRSEFGTIDFDSSEALSGEAMRENLEAGSTDAAIDVTREGQRVRISNGEADAEGRAPREGLALAGAALVDPARAVRGVRGVVGGGCGSG